MMIVLEFHVILLIICDCRASIVELRNAKNRAQGGPVREPIKKRYANYVISPDSQGPPKKNLFIRFRGLPVRNYHGLRLLQKGMVLLTASNIVAKYCT